MEGGNKMPNFEIRQALLITGIKQWKLAERLGVSESSLSKKLRKELTPNEKEYIVNEISKLAEGR